MPRQPGHRVGINNPLNAGTTVGGITATPKLRGAFDETGIRQSDLASIILGALGDEGIQALFPRLTANPDKAARAGLAVSTPKLRRLAASGIFGGDELQTLLSLIQAVEGGAQQRPEVPTFSAIAPPSIQPRPRPAPSPGRAVPPSLDSSGNPTGIGRRTRPAGQAAANFQGAVIPAGPAGVQADSDVRGLLFPLRLPSSSLDAVRFAADLDPTLDRRAGQPPPVPTKPPVPTTKPPVPSALTANPNRLFRFGSL